MTLYELSEQFQQLLEMIDNPEIPDDVLQDTMDAVEGELEDKADGYAKVIAQAKGTIELLKAEQSRLNSRQKSLENGIKRMTDNLTQMMQKCGKPKIKTELFSFNIQANPPKLVIDGDVPPVFMIPQDPKVNNTAIKDALKNGQELTFAHLEQTEGVRIR